MAGRAALAGPPATRRSSSITTATSGQPSRRLRWRWHRLMARDVVYPLHPARTGWRGLGTDDLASVPQRDVPAGPPPPNLTGSAILHYNGQQWQVQTSIPGVLLGGLSMDSAQDGWAYRRHPSPAGTPAKQRERAGGFLSLLPRSLGTNPADDTVQRRSSCDAALRQSGHGFARQWVDVRHDNVDRPGGLGAAPFAGTLATGDAPNAHYSARLGTQRNLFPAGRKRMGLRYGKPDDYPERQSALHQLGAAGVAVFRPGMEHTARLAKISGLPWSRPAMPDSSPRVSRLR